MSFKQAVASLLIAGTIFGGQNVFVPTKGAVAVFADVPLSGDGTAGSHLTCCTSPVNVTPNGAVDSFVDVKNFTVNAEAVLKALDSGFVTLKLTSSGTTKDNGIYRFTGATDRWFEGILGASATGDFEIRDDVNNIGVVDIKANVGSPLFGVGMVPANALDVKSASDTFIKAQNAANAGTSLLESLGSSGYVRTNGNTNAFDSLFEVQVGGATKWRAGVWGNPNNGHFLVQDVVNTVTTLDLTPGATGVSRFNGILGVGMTPTNALDVTSAASTIIKSQNSGGTGFALVQGSSNSGYLATNGSANNQDSYYVSEVGGIAIWLAGIRSGSNNGHWELFDFANSVKQIDVTPGAGTTGVVAIAGSLNVGAMSVAGFVRNTAGGVLSGGNATEHDLSAVIPVGALPASLLTTSVISQKVVTNASTLQTGNSFVCVSVVGVGAGNSAMQVCSDGATCAGGNIYLTCTFATATVGCTACTITKAAVPAATTLSWRVSTEPATSFGNINADAHMTTP